MIVVACVQSCGRSRGMHTIPGDFLKGDSDELGILAHCEDFAEQMGGLRILLLDNKLSNSLTSSHPVSSHFGENFSYEAVYFEADLQDQVFNNALSTINSTQSNLGEYCLIRDDRSTCSCGGILHELLKQLADQYPKEQEVYLSMYPQCFSRVKEYLAEWSLLPLSQPSHAHRRISIFGYGHSKDWLHFERSFALDSISV